MKTIKGVVWCLLALAAIGYVGRLDYQTERLKDAYITCQHEVPMQPCIDNNMEENSDY